MSSCAGAGSGTGAQAAQGLSLLLGGSVFRKHSSLQAAELPVLHPRQRSGSRPVRPKAVLGSGHPLGKVLGFAWEPAGHGWEGTEPVGFGGKGGD